MVVTEPDEDLEARAGALNRLVAAGDAAGVREALEAGGELLEARDGDGLSPLMVASRHRRLGLFELLLASGADGRARGEHGEPVLFSFGFEDEALSKEGKERAEELLAVYGAAWGEDEPRLYGVEITYDWQVRLKGEPLRLKSEPHATVLFQEAVSFLPFLPERGPHFKEKDGHWPDERIARTGLWLTPAEVARVRESAAALKGRAGIKGILFTGEVKVFRVWEPEEGGAG